MTDWDASAFTKPDFVEAGLVGVKPDEVLPSTLCQNINCGCGKTTIVSPDHNAIRNTASAVIFPCHKHQMREMDTNTHDRYTE